MLAVAVLRIRVQRMRRGVGHRVCRGDQRLADHLAAEHPLAVRVARLPTEKVVFDRFERQQLEQALQDDIQGKSWSASIAPAQCRSASPARNVRKKIGH